jgi:hypothetical protein
MGPAESATVTVAVVGVAAGWVGELSASEMVTGLWAAAMAQREKREIRKKDMVKAGKQSKAEKRIVQRTPEGMNRAILCLGESTSSLSMRKALLSQSYFPEKVFSET